MAGLFSPFKQVRRRSDAIAAHHLGLGLFIADQIVVARGGHMEVTSDEAGACFAAHLRHTRGTPAAHPGVQQPASDSA